MSEVTIANAATQGSESSESESKKSYFKVLIPYLVIILAQLPLVTLYFLNLWQTRPHYQICILAPVALGIFLFFWWPRTIKRPFFKSWFSVLLLAFGVMFATLATIFVFPWFAAFSFICLLASLLARTRNEETGKSLLPLVLLLLVFLQPPGGLDFDTVHGDRAIVTRLQMISSNVSSYFLDILGYKHNLVGAKIHVPDTASELGFKEYSVEAACSGIQSFFTLLFFTAIYIIAFKRPWFRAILLLLSAMFWAVIMNTIRILVIPIADSGLGMDLSAGFSHMVWGYIALGLGVLLVISTDQLLVFLFGPVDAETIEDENSLRKKFSQFWNSVFSGVKARGETRQKHRPVSPLFVKSLLPVAGLMCLIALLQIVDIARSANRSRSGVNFFDYDPTMGIADSDAPKEIGTVNNLWSKESYSFSDRERSSDLGQRSDMWTYTVSQSGTPISGMIVRTSFDQTFPGWHELTACYQIDGWRYKTENSRVRIEQKIESTNQSWPLIEAEFVNPQGQHGYLLFSLIDRSGEPYEAPSSWSNFNSTMLRIQNRLQHRIRARLVNGEGYQIQVFVHSQSELPEKIKQDVIENYLIFRDSFRQKFVDGSIKLVSEDPTVQQTDEPGSFRVDDANPAAQ